MALCFLYRSREYLNFIIPMKLPSCHLLIILDLLRSPSVSAFVHPSAAAHRKLIVCRAFQRNTAGWDINIETLSRYRNQKGDCLVPFTYETEDGVKLGSWANNQRTAYSKGTLGNERIARLEDIGFVMEPIKALWENNIACLVRYHEEKGDCLVPRTYETGDGVKLGHWVNNHRAALSKGKLSAERIARLEKIGFV